MRAETSNPAPGAGLQAVILAAGRGARMGPLTEAAPKCLARLAGRRLLDWQLDALHAAGLDQVTVVGGYRSDLLRFGTHALLENPEWAATNMVATLRCAAGILRAGPTLVAYGDIVYRADHVRRLAAAGAAIAICYDACWLDLWRLRFRDPLADAETFAQADGLLSTIGERAGSLAQIQGQYMGLLRFTPEGWGEVEGWLGRQPPERQRRIDMTGLLRGLLAEQVPIACVPVQGGWVEVDSAEDLDVYQARLAAGGPPWRHDWREPGDGA